MTCAYPEIHLRKAQAMLGDAFDYATNVFGLPGDTFVRLFVVSTVSVRMQNGETAYISGRGGIEVMSDVLLETTGRAPDVEPQVRLSRSVEFWIGWASAYYQWWSGRTYGEFFEANSFEDLSRMYATHHEADVSRFAEVADARVRARFSQTNLRRIRSAYGCTQAELARMSGVSLRSIQMYEQRQKDINKASAHAVFCLARALGCSMESLLER